MSNNQIDFCASMMCANYGNLQKEIDDLDAAGIDSYHIDVMDGNFVDNFGMGFQDMEFIRKATKNKIDMHLMIENAQRYLEILAQIHPDIVYIHPECTYAPGYIIEQLRKLNIIPGIAMNPGTSIYTVRELLNIVDRVLVMCVNPGHAGRQFESYVGNKIENLLKLKNSHHFEVYLDGAVTKERIAEYSQKGVKGFVLGTSVLFGHEESYSKILNSLRKNEVSA